MHEALADPAVWDLLPLSDDDEEEEEGEEEEEEGEEEKGGGGETRVRGFLRPLPPPPTRAQVLSAARDAEKRRCLGPCPLNPEQQLAVTAALAGARGVGGSTEGATATERGRRRRQALGRQRARGALGRLAAEGARDLVGERGREAQ